VNFIRKNLPNAMTLANLFCGCIALLHAFQGELAIASAFVLVALILDFFDGFTARLLRGSPMAHLKSKNFSSTRASILLHLFSA
jgi:phosphatidylserine synthase